MIRFATQLVMETTTVPKNAAKKLETANPSTKDATNQKSKALIMKINKPSVKIVIGNVKMTKIGLISKLMIPNKIAAIIAGYNPVIVIPGITDAENNKARTIMRSFVTSFISITIIPYY